MHVFSSLHLFCGLLTVAAVNAALAQQIPSPNLTTNLEQKIRDSNLIIIGQFLATTNDRKAKAPIKILETLMGSVQNETRVVACFRANALTISPKKGSKWIFLLRKPFKTEDGAEYRKIVGENQDDDERMLSDDYEGILPATDENIQAVKDFVVHGKAEPEGQKNQSPK